MSASPTGVRQALAGGVLAIAFLTVVPLRAPEPGPRGISHAAGWFPIVGALIGGLAAGVLAGADQLVAGPVAVVVALVCLVGVTGGLHQDGLADTFDGLGARTDRPRRLAAMRDSATGAFGVLALIAWALLMVTTLASLSVEEAVIALVVAAAIGRCAAAGHAAAARPARPDGLGAAFRPSVLALVVAGATTVALSLILSGLLPGLAALGAGLLSAAASTFVACRAFGGRTGDTLGATVAISEAAVCVALTAVWAG